MNTTYNPAIHHFIVDGFETSPVGAQRAVPLQYNLNSGRTHWCATTGY